MLMTEEYAQTSPFVLPYWRWEAAQKLSRAPSLVRQSTDPLLRDAAIYVRTKDRKRFPLIHSAREIFESDEIQRTELEARILAGQNNETVGAKCELCPQQVAVYHDLFLSVRGRLKTDWVLTRTVGPSRMSWFQNNEFRQFWAFMALSGGPLVVDELKRGFQSLKISDVPLRLSLYLSDDCEIAKPLQAHIAVSTIPTCESTWLWLFESYAKLNELGKISDRATFNEMQDQMYDEAIDLARRVHAGQVSMNPVNREAGTPCQIPKVDARAMVDSLIGLAK
ncbi:hypothetical protein GYB59_16950 [bacterium]|nr:hypothetical protein [bacterium]